MEIQRMLEVIQLRFNLFNPSTRKVNDEKFIIEVDNLQKTGRIIMRGIVSLENVPSWHSISGATVEDNKLVDEIKKVVTQALV